MSLIFKLAVKTFVFALISLIILSVFAFYHENTHASICYENYGNAVITTHGIDFITNCALPPAQVTEARQANEQAEIIGYHTLALIVCLLGIGYLFYIKEDINGVI